VLGAADAVYRIATPPSTGVMTNALLTAMYNTLPFKK